MKCRAYHDNALTVLQKKAMNESIRAEFSKLLTRYNRDTAAQIFHILHFDYGFGQARLEKFAKKLSEMQKGQEERYDLKTDDTPWICEHQLKADGIDFEALYGDGKIEV